MSRSPRRLLLVGGGHAHLEVLRACAAQRPEGEVVLISPHAAHLYSGRMPAQLRGVMAEPSLQFDLAALCRRAGVRFVQAAAAQLEASDTHVRVTLAGSHDLRHLDGDLLSLDVGSVSAGVAETPGAAQYAHGVRPYAAWQTLMAQVPARLEALAGAPERFSACVVGSGASGVELALAVQARASATPGHSAGSIHVQLLESSPRILGGWREDASARVHELLHSRGIVVRTRAAVARVEPDAVILQDGERIASHVTIWSTGAAPHPLLATLALPRDARGFLLVDATLRTVHGHAVWGAGDCVSLDGAPWMPKSGVYAVRAAPVLAHNLRAALHGQAARARFTPQRQALALLDTADGRAVAYRGGRVLHHAMMRRLKEWIDGRFMRRYQQLYR